MHQTGRLSEAEEMYRQVLKAQPNHWDSLHFLGVIHHQRGDYREAVRQIDAAIRVNPTIAATYRSRGNALQKLRQFDDAVASYNKAISLAPEDASTFNSRGNALQELKLFNEAVASYDEAAKLKPDYASAFYNRGNALQELKRFDEAVASYDCAIELKPNDANALNNRGNALHKLRRFDEAVASYNQAISLAPGDASAFYNRGAALHELKRFEEAVVSYDRAIELKLSYPGIFFNRGNALYSLRQFDEALASYGHAIALKSDYAEAFNNRANVLKELNRLDEALENCERAITLKPDYADAHYNRGNALEGLNQFDAVVASYTQAIALAPDHKLAFSGLADCALKLCDDDAIAAYREAIRIEPNVVVVYCNLGIVLWRRGQLDEAVTAFCQAVALQPDHTKALFYLVVVCTDQKRLDEAVACYDRALSIGLDFLGAGNRLGLALFEYGYVAKALACYRSALVAHPDSAATLVNYGNALTAYGRPDEAIASLRRAIAATPDDAMFHTSLIFALNFSPAATAADHQLERAAWAKQHASCFSPRALQNDSDPDRRLRIGYVSSHFRRQAATYAFGGVIANHDPECFEVTCYSDTPKEDEVTRHLCGRADRWHRTAGFDDEALAELIRADRIDILVDLVGHMRGHRLLVFARKPAPIQVTAWGEPNGTGLPTMDYLLADPVLVPAKERELLVEEVVDLPNYLGLWLPEPVSEPKPLPARSRGHITFGSFKRLDKVQEPVLARWAAILRGVPRSRLVLKEHTLIDAGQKDRILTALAAHGVPADRVSLLGWRNATEQYEAYHDIDLALDPFPHNGAMTTLEALWMGVPVVTCAGSTIPSRLSAASLSALGLTDFIAGDLDRYVELAVTKARDVEGLARLRASLRERMARSDFADPARYARAVEAAYRQMWQHWCAAN